MKIIFNFYILIVIIRQMERLLEKIEKSEIHKWMVRHDVHFSDFIGELPPEFSDAMSGLVIIMEESVDRYTAFDGPRGVSRGDDHMLLGYFASNLFRDYNINDQFLQKRMIEVVVDLNRQWKQAKLG